MVSVRNTENFRAVIFLNNGLIVKISQYRLLQLSRSEVLLLCCIASSLRSLVWLFADGVLQ